MKIHFVSSLHEKPPNATPRHFSCSGEVRKKNQKEKRVKEVDVEEKKEEETEREGENRGKEEEGGKEEIEPDLDGQTGK